MVARETPKRHAKGLFLKLRNEARETLERNVIGALTQIKEVNPRNSKEKRKGLFLKL